MERPCHPTSDGVVLPDHPGCTGRTAILARVPMPRLRATWLRRPSAAQSPSRRLARKPDPDTLLPAVFTKSTVCQTYGCIALAALVQPPPPNASFLTTADNGGFWPATVCPLRGRCPCRHRARPRLKHRHLVERRRRCREGLAFADITRPAYPFYGNPLLGYDPEKGG